MWRQRLGVVGIVVLLVAASAACFSRSPDPCPDFGSVGTQPCPLPDSPSTPLTPRPAPAPRPEPALPAGRHPVVVHDCDLDGGYSVRERRNPPPDAGRAIDTHAIEVYETSSDHSFGNHPEGTADIYVHATIRPQVLVLKAYEPTLWRIHADPGVVLAMVVVDGYHRQRVEGVPGDIEVVTSANWPSIPDRRLAELADQPRASETYCYNASLFSVRQYTGEVGR
ncbi:hypothetical protein ACFVMC_29690 [Nocardia sp. NPDC127579]|uniref:hypothetical protein n=1 Tax=Nocardia sp. NPDC127579 TaxID=3345402 RepID=UPI003629A2A3